MYKNQQKNVKKYVKKFLALLNHMWYNHKASNLANITHILLFSQVREKRRA